MVPREISLFFLLSSFDHQDSRENKTNCFPRDHTLSVYCFPQKHLGLTRRITTLQILIQSIQAHTLIDTNNTQIVTVTC